MKRKERNFEDENSFESQAPESDSFDQKSGSGSWNESQGSGGGGTQGKKSGKFGKRGSSFGGESGIEGGNEGGEGVEGEESSSSSKIQELTEKVSQFIKDNDIDKEQLVKYGALAVLTLVGMRKSGLVGGILMTAAIGLVTKYVLSDEKKMEGQTAK